MEIIALSNAGRVITGFEVAGFAASIEIPTQEVHTHFHRVVGGVAGRHAGGRDVHVRVVLAVVLGVVNVGQHPFFHIIGMVHIAGFAVWEGHGFVKVLHVNAAGIPSPFVPDDVVPDPVVAGDGQGKDVVVVGIVGGDKIRIHGFQPGVFGRLVTDPLVGAFSAGGDVVVGKNEGLSVGEIGVFDPLWVAFVDAFGQICLAVFVGVLPARGKTKP